MAQSTVEFSKTNAIDIIKEAPARVLHVDDDAGFLKTAKQILEMQEAFQVETASSVEEAMEKMKKENYDAIVSDYQMPGKDGLEFLKELRKSGNSVPFVIFTGKGREEVAIKALNLGADQYLNKTGDPETVYCELAHNIRQVVEKKRALEMRNVYQQRFLCLVENAAAGVAIFDPQGRFTYVNDALANLLGYPARELAGRHFSDFLHKEDKPRILESFRQFSELETEPPTLEFRAVRKDGRLAYLMAKPTKSEIDGKIVGSQAIIVDITERKKTEQDLVDNQERLQRIFSASPDAITVSDMNGSIVECNQATLDMLELSSKEELIGKSGFEFIPEKDHQRVRENLGRALEQGSVKNVEYAFLTKSGREISTELSSSVLKDSSGKIVGFVSVTKDVTEGKKAKVALQESEERFRAIVENSPFGYYRVGKDGLWQYVNPVWERMHGLSFEEVVGKSFEITQTEDSAEQAKEYVKRALAGETIIGEFSRLTGEGDIEYHSFNIQPVKRNNEIVAIEGFINDITKRKKAEETLRNSEERWRSLAEGSPDHIMLLDLKGNILYINRTVPDLKREEVIGTSQFNYVPPEWHQAAKDCFKRVIETGKTDHYNTEYRTKDGEVRYFDVRIGPVFQEDRVVALISSSTDVTSQKKAGEKLRESEERYRTLFQTVREGIIVRGPDDKILSANPAAAALLGYERPEELVGKSTGELYADKNQRKAVLEDLMKKGHVEDLEVAIKKKDGTHICVSSSIASHSDKSGNILQTGFFRDITERKKMEEEVKSLARFPSENPNSVLRISQDSRILFANDAGKALLKKLNCEVGSSIPTFFKNLTVETLKSKSHRNEESEIGGRTYGFYAMPIVDKGYVNVYGLDITERKKAEEKLRIQREELQVILDSMPAKIWYKDRNNRLVRVNKAFAEYMGVSKENLEGKPLCDLFPPDIAQKCWEEDKEVIMTGQPKTDILDRHESAQGVRWFSTGKVPCREKEGNIIGTINFSVDITERKKAEEALHESIENYKELAESISDMFFAVDKNFRYTYWNKASEKLTGISAKDAIGKSLTEVFPDVKGTRVEQFYKDALRTQQPQSCLNKYQLKGKDYVFELNAYPTKTGLSVFVKDVTEREKMDETLKSSEQKFRGLVEDSAAAIATIDLKGRLTYVNKALADSLGYSVQEMSGRAFKDFLHPDDRGNLVRLFLKIIVLRRQPRKFEFRALRKDGAILHLNCRPSRLETAGKTRGFQAILTDNTEEKHMLERAEKLTEKLSVVGGLTRHDVNNKLSTILKVSYLLKQKLRDTQSLELVKATESAVHQIEGLFEFARTYEKLGTEESVYVDAEKVFNEAAMLFPGLKDIRIVNDCHGLTVFADSLLRQLFYNLIDNSLKHGERVSQVRVHYQTREDRLKLIYEDDGIGVPKAEKDKIFKEGYGKDCGHGLYLIKKMCEVYGWTIQETGTPGKGAQFTMTIPRTNKEGKENYRLS